MPDWRGICDDLQDQIRDLKAIEDGMTKRTVKQEFRFDSELTEVNANIVSGSCEKISCNIDFKNIPCQLVNGKILNHTFWITTNSGQKTPVNLYAYGSGGAGVDVENFKEYTSFSLYLGSEPDPTDGYDHSGDYDHKGEIEISIGNGCYFPYCEFDGEAEDIKWASGSFGVEFDFNPSQVPVLSVNDFFKLPKGKPDFRIEAYKGAAPIGGKDFHKSVLSSLSEVMKSKIEDPTTEEFKTGQMKAEDFSLTSIEILHDLLYRNSFPETAEKFDIEFLMFTKRFEIRPFYNACQRKLMSSVDSEKVIEILKVADINEDDDLFQCGIKFLKNSKTAFFESDGWRQFAEDNANLVGKIMKVVFPE